MYVLSAPFFQLSSMASAQKSHTLFQPIQVGDMTLSHRVVMAPMARFRADENHTPTDLMVQYYSQRASEAGSFLITEATIIAPNAAGIAHCPGIWSPEQIAGWKKVTHVTREPCFLLIRRPTGGRRRACQEILHLFATLGTRKNGEP